MKKNRNHTRKNSIIIFKSNYIRKEKQNHEHEIEIETH